MDLPGIREALRRRPFEPFSLRLADGRDLPVSHPEAVALGERWLIHVKRLDLKRGVAPQLMNRLFVAKVGSQVRLTPRRRSPVSSPGVGMWVM